MLIDTQSTAVHQFSTDPDAVSMSIWIVFEAAVTVLPAPGSAGSFRSSSLTSKRCITQVLLRPVMTPAFLPLKLTLSTSLGTEPEPPLESTS